MSKSRKQYPKMVRHGDVLLRRVDKPNLSGARKEGPDGRGRAILVEGELTGHAHAVPAVEASIWAMQTGQRFLEVYQNETKLSHEDHGPIMLGKGFYEIVRQREYSADQIRYVAD